MRRSRTNLTEEDFPSDSLLPCTAYGFTEPGHDWPDVGRLTVALQIGKTETDDSGSKAAYLCIFDCRIQFQAHYYTYQVELSR
jgi:hypothetical protein